MEPLRWPRAYVDLILRFARQASRVGMLPIEDALLLYTPLYLNFGLDRSFLPTDPIWQEFLAGYAAARDEAEWTHSFYLAHARSYGESPYGCFAYHYEPDARTVRFHFGNRDTSGFGPLSGERREERLRELSAMFADVRRELPEAQFVRGRSWLYNLPSYRRLFPPAYVESAVQVEPELQFLSLWGQFLDHEWRVDAERARAFLRAVDSAGTLDRLSTCFPLPVVAPRCSIDHFYAHYGVDDWRTSRERLPQSPSL